MTPEALALTAAFGAGAGLIAGAVGIGGGVLLVPFLYLLFSLEGLSGVAVPQGAQAAVAHATSLFVVVPTALSALWGYRESRLIDWRVAIPMAGSAVVLATVAARVAVGLRPELLRVAFGFVLLFSAGFLALPAASPGREGARRSLPRSTACGATVGLVSGLLGIGGGVVAIPLLIFVVGLDLSRVAATSVTIVTFSAMAALGGYVVAGLGVMSPLPGSFGYVFLPAGLALLPGAVVCARLGTVLNRRAGAHHLRTAFAVLLGLVGLGLLALNLVAILPSAGSR
jgi:uncharacterized membrane protein YfcA